MRLWRRTCRGALRHLLEAAVVVEDVSLQGAQGGNELLAALIPAAETLRCLDFSFINEIHNEVPSSVERTGLANIANTRSECSAAACRCRVQTSSPETYGLRVRCLAASQLPGPQLEAKHLTALSRMTSLSYGDEESGEMLSGQLPS
jgi:hypothetical protein